MDAQPSGDGGVLVYCTGNMQVWRHACIVAAGVCETGSSLTREVVGSEWWCGARSTTTTGRARGADSCAAALWSRRRKARSTN